MTDRPVYPIFNLLSDVYDNSKFFPVSAERLIAHAKIIPGQCVLDVACSTGWATMAAALGLGVTDPEQIKIVTGDNKSEDFAYTIRKILYKG